MLAYPTFCLCAYVSVRALSGDGRRWTAAAIVLSVVALEVRKELICAGAALALAAMILWVAGPAEQASTSAAGACGTTSGRESSSSAHWSS